MISGVLNSEKQIILISAALALAAVLFMPYLWFGILALICIISFILFDEKYLLSASIILFLVMTSDFAASYRNYLNVILIFLLLFLYIRRFGLSAKSLFNFPKEINYLIALTLISMLVSSIFSSNIIACVFVTLRQLVFFIIVYIYFSFINDKKTVLNYLNSLIIVSIILGLVIFYDIFSEGLTLFSFQTHSFNQFSGLYSNPNAVGILLAVTIPVMIALSLIKRNHKSRLKYFYYSLLAFLLIVLLLTDSRASIGAVFISMVFILWRLKPRYLKFFLEGLTGLALLIIIVPVLNKYFGIYFRVDRILENTRYQIWTMSFDIIKHNFLVGVGPDLFWTKIYTYLPVMLGSFEAHQIWWARSGAAHNFFLYKFAEMGILGLASAIYLFVIYFKLSFKAERLAKVIDKDYYYISVAISSIGLGLLGRSFLEATSLISNGWITRDLPFWMVVAITAYLYKTFIDSNLIKEK